MNRYEFENLISDYLEGELSFSKRKEFESYLEENEDAKLLFFRVKNTLNDMKNAEKISTSENFNSKLLSKPSSNSNLEYSLVPIDKSQKVAQSQTVKNNTSFTTNDNSDSLDVNTKEYKPNRNDKIKFVNY